MSDANKAGADAPAVVKTLDLMREITAHGEKIKRLEFIEPCGGDIADIGLPVVYDFSVNPPRPVFDPQVMTNMLSALARVPVSAIRQMSSRDWSRAAWQVAGFFMPSTDDI